MQSRLLLPLIVLAARPIPFEQQGKWGYKDGGTVVIRPRFETAGEFSAEGIAAVVDEKGWAYIDTKGRLLLRPYVFDNGPDYFQEGLARFTAGGKIGFFDRHGRVVIAPKFTFALPFSDGLAAVCDACRAVPEGEHSAVQGGRWGFIDRRGAAVIPLQFEEVEPFQHGRTRVKSQGKWKWIDRKGATLESAPIGTAWMEPDGTIVLQLRAEAPGRTVGDALIRYPRNDPQHKKILRHLGGLKPGESKPVPPWPDK